MIDWTRIEELRTEIGAEDFAEIAGLFLAEVEGLLETLDPGAAPAALSDSYHSLKGSALNLGFALLAELCAAAETTPAAADPETIRSVFGESRTAFDSRFPEVSA